MTVFDALLLLVIGVSIFFAAVRGAIRELGTVLALTIAAGLAYAGAAPVAAALGKNSFVVSAAVAAAIGVVAFLGGYIILHKAIMRLKLTSKMRSADRIGGGAFGLLRALALIGLGFLGYGYYLDEANQPDSVRNALLLPIATSAAGFFEQFAPANRDLSPAVPAKSADAAADGYEGVDRAGLTEIVTTVTTKDAATPTADPIAEIIAEDATSDAEPDRR